MGKPIAYSKAELSWIKANCNLPRRDGHCQFVEKFNRSDVSLQNFIGLRKRNGWLTGRTGRFVKGCVPANKGKKMPFNENSARTQFKKGQAPHNTKYVGHERINTKDGYVYISVNETNPYTGFERRHVLKHKWLWEQKNGPVPEGHTLKCLDGNRQNCDPENWVLVSRSMLPRLSGRWGVGYDEAPDELKPTIMAAAQLQHKARERKKRS